jgi:type II secretory pathway pseudopilin PulG
MAMPGYSLIDLLVTMAVAGCVMSVSVPRLDGALDTWRTRGAAFFIAERVALTRMQAVHRGANVALRFEPEDGTFRLRAYADGNDNGVRSADIGIGYDPPITPPDRLDHLFPGARFGFIPGARLIDGTAVATGDDPIRFGDARMIASAPAGTATSGTAYIRGRGPVQFAVVVLGATGRARVVRFDPVTRQWLTP